MLLKKAVVPAAGLGTRMYPAAWGQPKEMLPLGDRPAIHYVIAEAADAGIEQTLVVVNREKSAIADYFDLSAADRLLLPAERDRLGAVQRVKDRMLLLFGQQRDYRGPANAILDNQRFVGDEPFAVLLPDDVCIGSSPHIGLLAAAAERFGPLVVGVRAVAEPGADYHSWVTGEKVADAIIRVTSIKTGPSGPGMHTVGRYALSRPFLEATGAVARRQESVRMTDALNELVREGAVVYALVVDGDYYDMGSRFDVLRAAIDFSALDEAERSRLFAAARK